MNTVTLVVTVGNEVVVATPDLTQDDIECAIKDELCDALNHRDGPFAELDRAAMDVAYAGWVTPAGTSCEIWEVVVATPDLTQDDIECAIKDELCDALNHRDGPFAELDRAAMDVAYAGWVTPAGTSCEIWKELPEEEYERLWRDALNKQVTPIQVLKDGYIESKARVRVVGWEVGDIGPEDEEGFAGFVEDAKEGFTWLSEGQIRAEIKAGLFSPRSRPA